MMRLTFRLSVALVAATSLMVLCGCTKGADTAGTGGAAPSHAPEVQSQINAQQKSEASERASHAAPAPK